jgi:hypothetical protein
VQNSLNKLLGLRLAEDGIMGAMTRSAVRSFQKRSGLVADGIPGPITEAALQSALLQSAAQSAGTAAVGGVAGMPSPGTALPTGSSIDWSSVDPDRRMLYVMELLIGTYQFPVNGAAGLVGNLWAESGVIPNRIEGSSSSTPMRARNFMNQITDFTPDEIMNRSKQAQTGPRLPGTGLAQWTSTDRRRGLFQHSFQGRAAGAAILFDMDAQVDYLVRELQTKYRAVYNLVTQPGVSVNDACDEVIYRFEVPGSVMENGRLLPRSDSRVQAQFAKRRVYAQRAKNVYMNAHP